MIIGSHVTVGSKKSAAATTRLSRIGVRLPEVEHPVGWPEPFAMSASRTS